MLCSKRSNLIINCPAELPIYHDTQDTSTVYSLFGQISCTYPRTLDDTSTHVQVVLARIGEVSMMEHNRCKPRSGSFSSFKRIISGQHTRKIQTWEPISAADVQLTCDPSCQSSCTVLGNFKLSVPSRVPPTTTLPIATIHYQVIARYISPNGEIIQASEPLRISRRTLGSPRLLPPLTTTFPESPISIKLAFGKPCIGGTTLPISLEFDGIQVANGAHICSVPSVSWMRGSETRATTPREITWEIEEATTIVYGHSNTSCSDMLSINDIQRAKTLRTIRKGKHVPKLRYPFTNPYSANSGCELATSFNIPVPDGMKLTYANDICVIGEKVHNTVAVTCGAGNPEMISCRSGQMRFAVCVEYTLRVRIEMGEDTFHKTTGCLVHRKESQFAYTVECRLRPTERGEESSMHDEVLTPPSYESAIGN